jgi:hypothetical protein
LTFLFYFQNNFCFYYFVFNDSAFCLFHFSFQNNFCFWLLLFCFCKILLVLSFSYFTSVKTLVFTFVFTFYKVL